MIPISWVEPAVALAIGLLGQVYAYEGDVLPVEAGWTELQVYCEPEQWLEGGRLYQHTDMCAGVVPPTGQRFDYGRGLTEYLGAETFFFETSLFADGDSAGVPFVTPGVIAAWSQGPVNYHLVISRDQIRFVRDNALPVLYIDIAPNSFHTFRVELYGAELYTFFIDGVVIDSGVPEAAFPSFNPALNIGAGAHATAPTTTTIWDYVRYGVIPTPASGDFDSDGDLDLRDWRYLHECLSNGGVGVDPGPACRWADMNFDFACDFHDFGAFQRAFTDGDNE